MHAGIPQVFPEETPSFFTHRQIWIHRPSGIVLSWFAIAKPGFENCKYDAIGEGAILFSLKENQHPGKE
jgi:hypothetical protein